MEEIIDNIPEQQVYDVIVIGAGAAGMMAAVSAARNGKKVTLIEQNEKLGKKLFITASSKLVQHVRNMLQISNNRSPV